MFEILKSMNHMLIDIVAWQLTDDNATEVLQALGDCAQRISPQHDCPGGILWVQCRTARSGWRTASAGDWICRYGPVEFEVIVDDKFRKFYRVPADGACPT